MNAVIAHEFGHQLGLIDIYNTGAQPFITEVVADFRPDEVLKLDTSATEYRISQIEAHRALVAKRRREEEELMAILIRAA